MYRRIILAYDGTVEGRRALREGALLARTCGAEVFLLAVVADSTGVQIAESALAGAVLLQAESYAAILQEGVDRLKALGFTPEARLVQGEPAPAIAAVARQVGADLVVVGHRRRGLLERWWSGSTGSYLLDHIGCSLLVSRQPFSDEAFAQAMDVGKGAA
jgi:nucleotide-binding universal stress UspA family protein